MSVTVRLAVAAMIAADGRFDQTRAVGIVAARERVAVVARMLAQQHHRGSGRVGLGVTEVARDRLADEGAELIVCHDEASSTVRRSTIPMIAASTGAAF